LPQLVQAIKFEKRNIDSPLVSFLIEKGLQDDILGNFFHWFLMVECQDKKYGRMFGKVAYQYLAAMVKVTVD
jgi:phosphatidylinositol 3-kinase